MKINWSGISRETWIRTICTVVVIVNYILKACNLQPIEIGEGTVAAAVEVAISVFVIFKAWWKNNSFTKSAQVADLIKKDGE